MLRVAEELCIVRRRRLPENNTETAGGRGDALPPLLRRIMMKAMSFSDTIFLFFLALILFGPKKLPGIARQAGRLLADLRRASNEFKSQIETEIAHLETEKPTILPPSPPPQGTVASLNSSPVAVDPVPHQLESPVSPDIPAEHSIKDPVASASSSPDISSSSTPAAKSVADPAAPQESHV
jgi:Sec-independent protein translocase protein TatA